MFKKFKSGVLIIILAVLMVVYLIVRFSGSGDRTFKDKVLQFDPSSITEILINDPKNMQGAVDLLKSGDNWIVKAGDRQYNADTNTVYNILRNLSDLPTKRYAGKGKEAWEKYELTDTAATRVTLLASGKTVAEVHIGKFLYEMAQNQQQVPGRQPRADMSTYVRLDDEKEVYATEGYLKMSISSDADGYRNRNLVTLNHRDITRITVTEPGNKSILENQDGQWLNNGMPADSAQMAKYSTTLSRLKGTKFYNEDSFPAGATYSLLIEGNNFTPVELQAYPVADSSVTYVISSSAIPGTYFNGKEGGLFEKIWMGF